MINNNEISDKEITYFLEEFSKGDKKAFNKLFPLVYRELRKNAHNLRFRFFDLETLNTTAVVHETYLKILRSGSTTPASDIYQMGMVLYRIITGIHHTSLKDQNNEGVPGHRFSNFSAVLRNKYRKTYPLSSQRDLHALLRKSMSADPERRYLNAGSFKSDLEYLLYSSSPDAWLPNR